MNGSTLRDDIGAWKRIAFLDNVIDACPFDWGARIRH
jgi:hypothetical protein